MLDTEWTMKLTSDYFFLREVIRGNWVGKVICGAFRFQLHSVGSLEGLLLNHLLYPIQLGTWDGRLFYHKKYLER